MSPRILLWDVENSPSLGYFFDPWKQGNIIRVKEEWFMLSYAYRWLGEKKTHVRALPDYPGYNRARHCDRSLVQELWELLSSADITIAHNGDRFDIKKAYTRFLFHNLPPPNPSSSIDTLKLSRKHFKITFNKLDHICRFTGIGAKLPHTGEDLWFRCMEGPGPHWNLMKKYNAHDVNLLHDYFLRVEPYITGPKRTLDILRA